MKHPLEFIPGNLRKRFFLTFLFLTFILAAILRVLDRPLQTSAAPNGIVSFELAGNAQTARAITDSWKQLSLLLSATADRPNPDIVNVAYAFAAFGLGIDYLFMPVYALALAFATLLAGQNHTGWIRTLTAIAGYGALMAALFDAVENYALFRVLLGVYDTGFPEIASFCAIFKFGLILFGIVVALVAWISPKKVN